MFHQEPKCFIKYMDGINIDSGFMEISVVLDQVKNGTYGGNLELIEPYIIDNDIPQVLRTIARFTDSEGLVLVTQDDAFEAFIKSLGMDIPQSLCLKYLQNHAFNSFQISK